MKYITLLVISLALTSCAQFKNNPDGLIEQAIEEAIENMIDVEIDLSPEEKTDG